MKKDWIDREQQSNDLALEQLKTLEVKFGMQLEEILALISLLYMRMGKNIDLSSALVNGNLNGVILQLDKALTSFYSSTVIPQVEKGLVTSFVKSYNSAERLLSLPKKVKQAIPYKDRDFILSQINVRWAEDGKLYSDRLWTHKDQLLQSLKTDLINGVMAGKSVQDITNQVVENVGQAYRASEAVVRTETNFVIHQSEKVLLQEYGVKKYRFLAEIDNRTSTDCKGLNGKEFLLSEAVVGTNYPPIHPNCRSTVIPIVEPV